MFLKGEKFKLAILFFVTVDLTVLGSLKVSLIWKFLHRPSLEQNFPNCSNL